MSLILFITLRTYHLKILVKITFKLVKLYLQHKIFFIYFQHETWDITVIATVLNAQRDPKVQISRLTLYT